MTEESSQPEVPGATAPGRAGKAAPAPATGDPRVDEALAALADLGEVPDTEHVEAFEHVHRQLQAILGEVGGEQGKPARPGPGA